ncbi:MAG: hypothetical protein K0R73_801 [Candidatus Midichloriaceae bacterium]|jgi:hypothetical protein|nr:hypothetical protein [Candidatus Midichloriaceae bacterium]
MDIQKLAFGLRTASMICSAFCIMWCLEPRDEQNLKRNHQKKDALSKIAQDALNKTATNIILAFSLLSPFIAPITLACAPITVAGVSLSDNRIALVSTAIYTAISKKKVDAIVTIIPAIAAVIIENYAAGGGISDFAQRLIR